jgi:hypothetical protein
MSRLSVRDKVLLLEKALADCRGFLRCIDAGFARYGSRLRMSGQWLPGLSGSCCDGSTVSDDFRRAMVVVVFFFFPLAIYGWRRL